MAPPPPKARSAPNTSAKASASRAGIGTRQQSAAIAALGMIEARDTPPPPCPSISQFESIDESLSRRLFATPKEASFWRKPADGDSDDDPELASTAPTSAPATVQATSTQPTQPDPPTTHEVYIYVIFLIPKAKGTEGERKVVHDITFEASTEEAPVLTQTQYSTFVDKVLAHAQAWGLSNGVSLINPDITATAKYERLGKASEMAFALTSADEWRPIAEQLLRFIKQNRKNIIVEVVFKYRFPTVPLTSKPPPSSQPQSLADSGHLGGRDFTQTPTTTPAPTITPGRQTTTQQQVREVEAENSLLPLQNGIEWLGRQWLCTKTSCWHHGGHCWYPPTDPMLHYAVEPEEIERWYAQIQKDSSGRLTWKEPPPKLMDVLRKNRENHLRREKRQSTSTKVDVNTMISEASNRELPVINVYAGNDMNNSALLRELKALKRTISGGSSSPSGPVSMTPQRSSTSIPYPPNPPSSPISSHLTADLHDFIVWLCQQRPADTEKFNEAYTVLEENSISMEQIQASKRPGDWDDLGIKPGVGWLLAKHIKRWEKTLHGPARGYIDTPRRSHTPPQATTLAVRPSPRKQRGDIVYQSVEVDTADIDTQADITTCDEDDDDQVSDIDAVNAEQASWDSQA